MSDSLNKSKIRLEIELQNKMQHLCVFDVSASIIISFNNYVKYFLENNLCCQKSLFIKSHRFLRHTCST